MVRRKIYAEDFTIKMMSEDEAKKDKLNQHFFASSSLIILIVKSSA